MGDNKKPLYIPDADIETPNSSNISPDDIKNILSNENISKLLKNFNNNSNNNSNNILGDSMSNLTPDFIDNAKKLFSNGKSQELLKSLKKEGINLDDLKSKLSPHIDTFKSMSKNTKHPTQKCILITSNRQLKVRYLPVSNVSIIPLDKEPNHNLFISTSKLLKISNPTNFICKRLSIGIFSNKEVTIWYDKTQAGKNKRASKIAGFNIAGDILISLHNEDLNESDILSIEKLL